MHRIPADQWAGNGAQGLLLLLALPPTLATAHLSECFLERRLAVWLRARLRHQPPMQPPALALPSAAQP